MAAIQMVIVALTAKLAVMPRFKRGIQYAAAFRFSIDVCNTGSPACAGNDAGGEA
jgi:hypothetical protein